MTGRKARFVVLEGLDGVGTTTQATLAAEALQARDLRVHLTSEPSAGPIGPLLHAHLRGEIDLDPHTAALAFTGDRADHLATVIRPALARGAWVICDRYLLSTLAYQGSEGVDREWILAASRSFEVPDLTLVLEIPEPVRAERLGQRPTAERYEAADLASTLTASYRTSVELLRTSGHRIVEVDSSGTVEATHARVMAQLDALG